MADATSTTTSGSATTTSTITEAGGMGGPTVVITAAPSVTSAIVSNSINGVAGLAPGKFVGSWGGLLCAVGAGAVTLLGGVW
jgi:hypothetical protein